LCLVCIRCAESPAPIAAAAGAAAADAADGDALSAELSACRTESDKAGLRLFNAYLKAGRQGRALEVVGGLHNIRSIEGEQGGADSLLACTAFGAVAVRMHGRW
jgi:hypothetical protein